MAANEDPVELYATCSASVCCPTLDREGCILVGFSLFAPVRWAMVDWAWTGPWKNRDTNLSQDGLVIGVHMLQLYSYIWI